MKKKIDTQSLLIGTLLGVIAVVCLGAALKHSNQPGRFQLGVGAGPAFVIDTVSGQVWQQNDQKEFFAPKAE